MAFQFLEDFVKEMRSRFSNPILAPFTLAWLAWNYQGLLVLAGDWKTAGKISYVSAVLGWEFPYAVFPWVIAPGVTTAVFLWLFPRLQGIVLPYLRSQEIDTKSKLDKTDGAVCLTKAESEELFAELAREQRQREMDADAHVKELAGRDDHIKWLTTQNGRLRLSAFRARDELAQKLETQLTFADVTQINPELPFVGLMDSGEDWIRNPNFSEPLCQLSRFYPNEIDLDTLWNVGAKDVLRDEGVSATTIAIMAFMSRPLKDKDIAELLSQMRMSPRAIDEVHKELGSYGLANLRPDLMAWELTPMGHAMLVLAARALAASRRNPTFENDKYEPVQ